MDVFIFANDFEFMLNFVLSILSLEMSLESFTHSQKA